MAFVSCRQAPPDPEFDSMVKEGASRIICTDDQDQEWHLTTDSTNGEWREFQASGGTVEPYSDAPPLEDEQAPAKTKTKKR